MAVRAVTAGMDDIRDERESSLTERKPGHAAETPDQPAAGERHKVGPESEVRGGPEVPEEDAEGADDRASPPD